MIKKVFRPFWSYDVQKTEEWLTIMAENGYFLVKLNRASRCFFFQKGVPKKLTYRIGYDKIIGNSLSKSLLDEGWKKLLQSGSWYVTVNERLFEQVKASPIREGIIKHNRTIMYIYLGIFIYLSIILLFNIIMGLSTYFGDVSVDVVESPFWIITYIFLGIGTLMWSLAIYSIIKISKVNKKLSNRKPIQNNAVSERQSIVFLSKAEEKQLKRSGQMVVKRKLGWMYAPDKLEQWLEEMEQKGYNLNRVSKTGTAFYFLIGHSRKVSYCADYQNLADESYFDIHREAGWRNIFASYGSLQKWSIWSCEYAESGLRPQIFTDKINQLKHARLIAITYSCIFLPIIIVYLFNIGLRFELFSINKVDIMYVFNFLIMVIAILLFGTFTVRTWLYYLRLKKTL